METKTNTSSANNINQPTQVQQRKKDSIVLPHIRNELELSSKSICLLFLFFFAFGLFSLASIIFLPEIIKLSGTNSELINLLPTQDMITALDTIF